MKLFERKKKKFNKFDKIKNFFSSCKNSVVNVILSISSPKENKKNIKNILKKKNKNKITELEVKIFQKILFLAVLTLLVLIDAFGWFYNEYVSKGTIFSIGRIEHSVIQYDETGKEIHDGEDTLTLMNVDNISHTTKGTRYISIENVGTLDMVYYLTFLVDSEIADTGIMYYRIYEVTDAVNSSVINASNPTKLEAYAALNPTPSNLETDTTMPVSNLTTITNLITTGQINRNDEKGQIRYYRIDYGVYQTVNSDKYNDKNIIVHAKVLSTQVGASVESSEGVIWEVETEEQFRDAVLNGASGDTIKLMNNIDIDGSVDIQRRIHLDLNEYKLNVTGDLIWDFIELGELKIDTAGTSQLDVGNDLYINAPKTKIHLQGSNNDYDIFVGGEFTVNGLQNEEEDGVLLENIRIVKNKIGNIPADVIVLSNTRLTIGPDVALGYITAAEGTTNIEIINNGNVVQLRLDEMSLIDSFSKPQIYVYNLGVIQGIAGGSAITLPSNAKPYLGANKGNTLIIKGLTSNDLTVSGSNNFTNNDIGSSDTEESVIPIDGEENAYIVYIRTPQSVVRELLITYFQNHDSLAPLNDVAAIKKLIIYTVNTQYFENEDFTFLNSSEIPNLSYLDLSNASVKDNTTINQIPAGAMNGKTSLTTLILPKTVITIGDNAFKDVPLGKINSDGFTFLTIPSTVERIGANAFSGAKYVKFLSQNPPEIGVNAFNNSVSGVRYFVPEPSVDYYQETENIDPAYVHITAELSDNKAFFVYEHADGLGISLYVSTVNAGDNLAMPNTITLTSRQYPVTAVGVSAFRHIKTPDTGTNITLPETVVKVDDYAFYNIKVTNINIPNVTFIGNYAFYNTLLPHVVADYATYVGDYAFYNTPIETASFERLITLGKYALANTTTLYDLNLGTVESIGIYAVYNNPQLGRVYFKNTNAILRNNAEVINLTYGENALFYEWGKYLDGRLRIYVPDGTSDSGKEFIELYKAIFQGNEQYIYRTGTILGNYTHVAIPYDFGEYTVREVSKTNGTGSIVDGYEIISYQGADLTSSYKFPDTLTVNGVTKPVISVGDNAFRNSIAVNNAAISIVNNNLAYIGDYAFTGLGITVVRANAVLTIGDYAFANTKLQMAEFKALGSIGDYAVSDINTLNHLNLGTVKTIGISAVSNNPNLVQLYINNVANNITLEGLAFNDIGTNAGNRLRIYVPYSSLDYYKTLLSDYKDYIYPIGYLKGNYVNAPIMYDIGEFTVREVTINGVNGYEYVEYHGKELDSSFEIPTSIEVSDDRLSATLEKTGATTSNGTTHTSSYNVYVSNVGNETIDGWEVSISKKGFASLNLSSKPDSSTSSEDESNIIISNASWNKVVNPGDTQYITIELTWTGLATDTVTNITASKVGTTGSTLNIISIGDNAFKHSSIAADVSINIENDNILSVGLNAFTDLKGINKLYLPNVVTIGANAFKNNTLTDIYIPNVTVIGASAFENNESLFRANLGEVSTMGANAITNAPLLYQVFFANYGHSLNISSSAIKNVGETSGDRLRFYVTNTYDENGKPYVDSYKAIFTEYADKFYAYDYILGSYVPANTNVDIGEYSIRRVSVTNKEGNIVDGFEFVEYHGLMLTSDFIIPAEVDVSANATDLTAVFSMTQYWGNNPWTGNYTLTVTNNTDDSIGNWRVLLSKRGFDTVSIVQWSGLTVTEDSNYIIITSSNNLQAGASTTIQGQITWGNNENARVSKVMAEKISQASIAPIISIGEGAFKYADIATGDKINIVNNNLLEVNSNAFANLDGLNQINLPNVVRIGTNAFYNTSVSDVSIPNVNSVQANAFAECESLYRIDLGTVSTLGTNAITNAPYLYQVFFKSNGQALNISSNAISDVGGLTNERIRLYVNNGYGEDGTPYVNNYKNLITNYSEKFFAYDYIIGSYTPLNATIDIGDYSIREATFKNKSNSNVTGWEFVEYHGDDIGSDFILPTSITQGSKTYNVISIGPYAFYNSIVISGSIFDINDSNLLNIGDKAFLNFTGLNTITADNVINIGVDAFRNSNVESASFANLKTTGTYAFANISNLKVINLGTISTIGEGLLYNDVGLYQIYFTNKDALTSSSMVNISVGNNAFYEVGANTSSRFRVYVPDGNVTTSLTYVQAYKNTLPSALGPYIFPTGVIVGSYQPSTRIDIGEYMIRKVAREDFSGTLVTGYEIVDYHGANIADNTIIPQSFTVDGVTTNVVSIGDYAYYYLSPPANSNWVPVLGNSVSYIGNYAFYKNNIKTITGNRITYIGKYAFADCEYLTTVTFQGVQYLDDYSFYSNSRMTYIEVGDGVDYIGSYALYNPYEGSPSGDRGPYTTLRIINSTPPETGTQPFPEIYSTLFGLIKRHNFTISVPQAARNTYANTSPWRDYTVSGAAYSGSFAFQVITAPDGTRSAEITSYTGNSTTIEIPETVVDSTDNTTYNVTSIKGEFLDGNSSATTLVISRYVENIEGDFLAGNDTLRTIQVNTNNQYFSATNGVLFSKDQTMLIKYPPAKTGNSYTMPNTTISLSNHAFANVNVLQQLTLSNQLLVISNSAFAGATSIYRITFQTATPPYLTGFKAFRVTTENGLQLRVPRNSLTTYQNSLYYRYYRSYMSGV